MLNDLQIDETSDQHQETQQNSPGRKSDAKAEAVEFAILGAQREKTVTQEDCPQIGRLASCSIGWYCGNSSTKVSGNQRTAPMNGPMKYDSPGKSTPGTSRTAT